jgi:choice-of-anchor A domain-containing protein
MLKKRNFKRNNRYLLAQIVFFFFLSVSSFSAQCITITDCDGDGVVNSIDLDDDNDGILDCEENGLNASSLTNLFSIAGNASFINSNEIELTPDLNNQAGSSMSFGKIDFNYDFNFSIEINLGNKDIGADGISIVFHNDPDGVNTVGEYGQGIGSKGIRNGIAIEFDTHQNIGDLINDHTQIKNTSNWVGLTSMTDLGNIEDDNWYLINFSWVAGAKILSYSFNGIMIANYTDDLISNVFNGESKVHFGFTASTGGLRNSHKIRLSNEFCSYPLFIDTDGDNIPNHLDTDSDNDGCPDAIEAAGLYSTLEVSNTFVGASNGGSQLNFPGPVNNKGIPIALGTTVGGNETVGQSTSEQVTTAEQITIISEPGNTVVNENENVILTIDAASIKTTAFVSGVPDYSDSSAVSTTNSLTYKWYKNSNSAVVISNVNTLNLNTFSAADVGDYTFMISRADTNCPLEQTITVAINYLPLALNDVVNVNENSPANTIAVLDNDTFGTDGPNIGTISFPATNSANDGTIELDNGGTANDPLDDTILYTPATDFTGVDTFKYIITDANEDISTAIVTLTVNEVFNCDQSPTDPAKGFNVFIEENLSVKATETKGAVAVGENLSIKGDYNVASAACGDFDTNGLKIGLLIGGSVNYPLNTVINTNDTSCNCGDPTIVNNGSFVENVNTSTWTSKNQEDIPGWNTTATDNKIEIWKSGFLGKTSQNGGFHAEINANQRAALYQVICAEPGAVLDWSIWHRGRAGVDVAEVKIGVSLNSAANVATMSTDQDAWKNYTGSYTVPAGEHTVYFVFQSISSQPYNNLSFGNLLDNFEVTKIAQGACPAGGLNPNGLLTVIDSDYYAKIGDSNGSVAWYFDEFNAPTPVRITPNATFNSSSRIQLNSSSIDYAVSAGNNPVYENNLIDFPSAFQSLRTNATNLAIHPNTAVLEDVTGVSISNTSLANHTEIFLNNGINYLNISGENLNTARIFKAQRSANSDRILIINIDAPGVFNWDVWEQQGFAPADSPYVLYNFFNTTTLTLSGNQNMYGTIFAPFSDLDKSINKADIYGQVIAKSLIHDGGIIHCYKFAAATVCPPITGVSPTSNFKININTQCFVANEFLFENTTNTGGTIQSDAPITYFWDLGDGSTTTEMNPTNNYTVAGAYTVTLTATNKYGTDSKSVQLNVLPVLEPIVTVATVSTTAGKVTKSFTIDNAASFTSFSWTLPNKGSGLFQNINSITEEFSDAGQYTVSVTAINNDCTTIKDITVTVSSDEVSGGNGGGVESESLGDAISKIYVGRKKKSMPTIFVKSDKNSYNKMNLKKVQPYQGKGQTLLDMFPIELVAGNKANVTSPTDILDYTVADEVLSVDFSVDGKTKGVVLGIKTSDKIYNHTKASCDRLRGAEILNIQTIELEGYNFLMQGIKQRNGVVEYAISFAVAKNNNDTSYKIQTNWYVNNYIKFNDVYNFQVWSTSPDDSKKLVGDILANLKAYNPVVQTEIQKVPKTYAAKIFRETSDLILLLKSTEKGLNIEISMEEIYSETANNVKYRYNALNSDAAQIVKVDIKDGYEYDALVKVNGEIQDAFYHADGNWGLDYDKRYTEVQNYFVWNNFDRVYQDDEHAINRGIEIKATSDYDYLTVYKSLLPGTLSADYSEYNYVAFTAKGSGLTELGLIKSSIQDWKAQYRIMVDLSEEEQTYYVPFNAFTSTGTQNVMTVEDLTTLTFTFLPVEAQTKTLDLTISDVKFTKTATEGQIVNKIETFENEFMAYPNPSKGALSLLLFSVIDADATITLSDITGKVIYKGKAQLTAGKNELDFDFKVTPGLMLLQVNSAETNYGTSKVIFR